MSKPQPRFCTGTAGDIVLAHRSDERLDVIAHEIELVHVVLAGWMDSYFRRRQTKDEPSVPDVDIRQLENVAQKGTVCIRTLAVDVECAPLIMAGSPLSAARYSTTTARERFGSKQSQPAKAPEECRSKGAENCQRYRGSEFGLPRLVIAITLGPARPLVRLTTKLSGERRSP